MQQIHLDREVTDDVYWGGRQPLVIAVQSYACALVDADLWLQSVCCSPFYSSNACHKISSTTAVQGLG
ncbi:hypothetical protein HBH70_158930 [Parastagonospora nodorum]|nr:hypothetical protein HBH92_233750 [Parastagonospora nodorum]KAH4436488.1 hypothetical protein HBH93_111890 [Parastagonospora nodorum]KAH4438581.1 hypothetical protein HBH91_184110 [Parastagonospora nodorum]KAH4487457.1 hypothetical protein HBH89_199820 [Parastagonospora nodorum]KAH4543134.1 hypothetical protein HBH86_157860 [Parastagonospora nodorum]